MRNKRYQTTNLPSHIVNDEEKKVYFLLGNGVGYLGIPTFLKSFPEGYKGIVVRTKEGFDQLQRELQTD